jgi:hypothetical protein
MVFIDAEPFVPLGPEDSGHGIHSQVCQRPGPCAESLTIQILPAHGDPMVASQHSG